MMMVVRIDQLTMFIVLLCVVLAISVSAEGKIYCHFTSSVNIYISAKVGLRDDGRCLTGFLPGMTNYHNGP